MNLTRIFSVKAALCLLLLLPSLLSTGLAQEIVPAIEREPGRGVEITVTNSGQRNSPIQASATIRASDNAYGAGFLSLKNINNKPVLGIRGCWEITTSQGGVLKDFWSFGGPTSLANGGTKQGEEIKVPVAGPPNYSVNKPHRITGITIRITGACFNDKTWWGDDGYALYQKIESGVEELRATAEKVRSLMDTTSPEVFVNLLTTAPNRPARGTQLFTDLRTRLLFKLYLLDEQNALRPDARTRLDKVIAALKQN
ncbi:MAG: hypothetical protein L0Y75_07120, partial [Acidobacteria bacterium]|nr:hypothetical protein [Acidobacteriota bacterium]